MARFFDIMPPKPKPAPQNPPRRRRKGCGWFLFGLIILAGMAIVFMGTNEPGQSPENSPVRSNQTPNFELFNNEGESNLTSQKTVTVRLLNASGQAEPVETAKKFLNDGGLKIEQVGESANIYEQTIIYYKKEQIDFGQKVQNLLKDKFQTKVLESENLGLSYDVLVIVGQK